MGLFSRIWARISSPVKYVLGPRRFWHKRGTTVDEDGAMKIAAFYRGLIYISSQIAKLPWDVKDVDNNILTGPVSNLLNLRPNPEMNAFRWRLVMVQQAIIHGNAFSEIERDILGRPVAMWPLETHRMQIRRNENTGALVYRYTNPDQGYVDFEPKDIFHLPNFHTKDGIVGQGLVAYGQDVLGIQIAADDMAGGLFVNSGIPSGVLSHPGKLSEEAYTRLKNSWAEQHGRGKQGSTSILEEGVKYEPVNINPDVLQFLESRQFGILEIARFLGIPPTKLFDVTASTYSNVEQSNLEVATDTLDSWATNLEIEADCKILSNRYGGRYTDIDLYSIFRGDMKTRSDYFKTMMSIGAMTPNQIRAREGMPGYKEGSNYYIATNNFTPVNRMNEIIDADLEAKKQPKQLPSPEPTPQKDAQPTNSVDSELEAAAIKYLTSK